MRKTAMGYFGVRAAAVCIALPMAIHAAGALSPARAHGAIAIGMPDDIAEGGLAMGTGYNYDTADGAKLRALQECLKFTDAPLETRGLCKIVESFDRKCFAISLDPKDGTPGAGWSVADKKEDAERKALEQCRQTAGADRATFCVVSLSNCDAP